MKVYIFYYRAAFIVLIYTRFNREWHFLECHLINEPYEQMKNMKEKPQLTAVEGPLALLRPLLGGKKTA